MAAAIGRGCAPVCSPALLNGLRTPADLAAHTLLFVEHERIEWQLWFDAADVAPRVARRLMRQGLTFDVAYMSLQAAIDGLGVALGYGPYVEADAASVAMLPRGYPVFADRG